MLKWGQHHEVLTVLPTSISLCGVCKNSLNPFQFMYHIRRLDDFGRSFNTIPQNQNIYHVLKGWNGLTTASTKQNISSRCKIYLMFYNNIVTGCLKENSFVWLCNGRNWHWSQQKILHSVIPASGSHVHLSNDLGRDNYYRQMLFLLLVRVPCIYAHKTY